MAKIRGSSLRKRFHQGLRRAFAILPTEVRFRIYRRMVDCDPAPDQRLVLKIADTEEELADCFKLLHDAYVSSGFMVPDPSGMRVTIYHALPTTTTLCAKYDGKVVGTISMIREGVFGFPLQSVFDLENVRANGGNIAEISALAVHPDFRKTGGAILFPLMKFMHEYCTEFFDTRHLVIAVNPEKIELYEALLFFKRLQANVVDKYDFANGAPAVGATLDLYHASDIFRAAYKGRPTRKNLHRYFFGLKLENIKFPKRRYFTTNDPVMTPALLNHFFNEKSKVFEQMDDRKKSLLWSIYDLVEYRSVLPMMSGTALQSHPLRRHQRYSIRCPAKIQMLVDGESKEFALNIIEISLSGFQAEGRGDVPLEASGSAHIVLGKADNSIVKATALRCKVAEGKSFYGFRIEEPDAVWRACVTALEMGQTASDLSEIH
ncbi:GNAT family N-acetyltransferase [Roseateles koreensis]|uniref:GNAT family N-acetyltransferase n=1 Tax=Roseateles koreensis TaxID=2987526 RepID=A0ABT5KWI7_9BURK|nr:GNAT family N-acetyltransferase [Roseateles koreensis]MDC8786186.1 GNAT family N-acetyltransferase [Roseateles koreensis]